MGRLLHDARTVVAAGADCINITDSSLARLHASSYVSAYLIQNHVGVDTIFHLTGRDRNILALQSDLLGAQALGLRNVLCLTGDPPRLGDHPDARPVYEVNSRGLLELVNRLNQGVDACGQPLTQPTNFFAGVAYGLEPIGERVPKRIREKMALGPRFFMTQPVYSEEDLERCRRLKELSSLPIIVGLLPLYSARNANFLSTNVPGIRIPQEVLDEINSIESKAGQLEFGIRFARAMLDRIRKEFAGVYLIPPFHKYHLVGAILADSLPADRAAAGS